MNLQNDNSYYSVKERLDSETVVITYKKKERSCDICKSVKKREDVTKVKYPIIDKYLGRVMMTRKVCNDCIDDVMYLLKNLKYK